MTIEQVSPSQQHLVLIAQEAWGHARPLCALIANITKLRPNILITFFTTANFYDRVENELSRHFDADAGIPHRIRLIALAVDGQLFTAWSKITAVFAGAYQSLVLGEPITCAKTGTVFPPVQPPDAAVIDFFGNKMLNVIRESSVHTKPIKVYVWVSCPVAPILWRCRPTDRNAGNLISLLEAEAARSGRPILDVSEEYFCVPKAGVVQNVPGMPPMYDHEFFPQERVTKFVKTGAGLLGMDTYRTLNSCDGMIVGSPECYEQPEAMSVLRQWYGQKGREVHVVGPMVPTGKYALSTEKKQSARAADIEKFLDNTLNTHGPNSLIYISFGSLFWSTQPEKIWAFVDVLLERQTPFIMSHASAFAVVPEAVKVKVEASGIGLLSQWSPQQFILSHPATGWFVTHCGFNSVIESITAGVPMICWPYTVDQPITAIHITHNLGIAYELLEVRTGDGLGPIQRTGFTPTGTLEAIRAEANVILDKAFGKDGAVKRAKVEKLQGELAHAWSEEGPSRKGLEGFLDTFHLPPAGTTVS